MWFVVVARSPLERLARLPRELSEPLGLFRVIPASVYAHLLSTAGLTALKWTLLVLLAAVVLGLRPHRLFAIPAALLLALYDSILKSYSGGVNHAQFCPLYFAVILALFPAADALSLTRARRRQRRHGYVSAMITLVLVFGLTYTFVGSRRLTSGIDVFYGDQLRAWLATRSLVPNSYNFRLGLFFLGHPLLATIFQAGFAAVTVLETLSVFILISDVFRRIWITAIVLFHLMTLLTMNIFFFENMLLTLFLLTAFAYRIGPRPELSRQVAPVVFFDGACGLCHRFVQWVIARDFARVFRFAPLQGRTAAQRLGAHDAPPWSLVLLDEEGQHRYSTASLRIICQLESAWAVAASAALYVPRPIRDAVYRVIARRRHLAFGNADACPFIPEQRTLILD